MNAQSLRPCGTDEAVHKALQEHPELLQIYQQNVLRTYDHEPVQTESMPPVYIIPVVFHIIHNYGTENISDAQVYDAISIMNRDFRKQNADTASVVPTFQPIIADAEIEFRLAQKDPNGNCTTGIDRIASEKTYIGDDLSKLNPWPRSKYLNIWVVRNISNGAAGYTYLPGVAPTANVDGIIVLDTYVGSIGTSSVVTSRTLTHETGHFLNLLHTWGSTNQPGVSCGDDFVNDTPITKGWTTCNLTNNKICTANVEENVQNYMEYSYCSRMFTIDQKTRMRNALNSAVGQRNNLPTAANLTATGTDGSPAVLCKPISDFNADYRMVCPNAQITLTAFNSGGKTATWSWSCPGATFVSPYTAADSVTVVQYASPGTYSVSLTVTNNAGTGSLTKTSYIYVNSTTAQFNTPFSESFETISVPNSNWIVFGSSPVWTVTNLAGYTGVKSVRIVNFGQFGGETDELCSPSYNLTTVNNPKLYFRTASAQKTSTDNDMLRVFISQDCGRTWTLKLTKAGAGLKTVSPQTTNWAPSNASQWRLDSINLSPYANNTNFRIKFQFISGGGNNIYIDDINVQNPLGIGEMNSSNFAFNVYPNPVSEVSTVYFQLNQKENVQVKVFDLLGKETMTIVNSELAAGEHELSLNRKNLIPGIYLVRLSTPSGMSTRKILVQ